MKRRVFVKEHTNLSPRLLQLKSWRGEERRQCHAFRLYDWEVDEHGGLRPMIDSRREHAIRSRSRPCANDSYILETILKKYNRHKIPGGSVNVQVEVWVQEITTISDITSDFQNTAMSNNLIASSLLVVDPYRLYDWEVDEHGGLRPMIDSRREHAIRSRSRPCANDSYILETILKKYNRHKIPGGSVNVQVEVWVQEITTISDITSDFQLDIYISEMWLDPALDYSWMEPCKYNLSLNSVLLEKLWTPNSCFINSKTADIHKSPFPNIFLMIYANGSVWTNYRLKLQGPCEMDLTRFPFDNVTCSLTFESFNYNTDEVQMSWSPLGVSKMREKMELADYELTGIENLKTSEARFWHELTMRFHFKRRAGWYILQAYLPTYLTICICVAQRLLEMLRMLLQTIHVTILVIFNDDLFISKQEI
ncbi:Ligand-gated ion channel 50 [Toxocara canis]|uniref:Ligand-gated ion channel 50 n=1 Tax=Toxocara canis TaxID=6265 RepID=A0A0B2W3V8_TOXCA|nr:Ligand-gated ion channel 50 [Toxocara canis]